MKIELKKYESDGVKITYFITGQGKPLLFFHGGGVDMYSYSELLEKLSANHQVIAVDLPCFGRSSIPKTIWNFTDYGKYFSKFISHLNLKDLTVVGHSFGAGVGIALAIENKTVDKLVLIGGAGISRGKNALSFYMTLFFSKTFQDMKRYGQYRKIASLCKAFSKNILRRPFQQIKVLRIMERSMTQKDLELSKIKAKTLILWGDEDELFALDDARELDRRIPNSELVVVDGNHDWCLFEVDRAVGLINQI